MGETIFFPSPNWFQSSGMAVSSDGWLVYGGPTKSLCVLEPLPEDDNSTRIVKGHPGYTAHVVNRAHPEKIVCVDISPEWPEKRCLLTGSEDGTVKQWILEKNESVFKIKSTHSHEIHRHEEVVGVGYCKDGYAVTVGTFGNVVKWDLKSNVTKHFNHVLKSFKPTCMACSPHIHLNVAIGTKQGVLLVLDLNGSPRIIYKVRGQDNEILKVSWCPQYEVAVRKSLKEREKSKKSTATKRMDKIRQEATSPNTLKALDERVQNSQTSEQPVEINENSEPVAEEPLAALTEQENESGIGKTLPEDSFDCGETVVQEDDTFDIYKDHEADEFGHKKYQPIDILVKVPTETAQQDYLSECQKLKEEILKKKEQSEASIATLVDALEKTQVGTTAEEQVSSIKSEPPVEGKIIKGEVESSVHIHKHLLATIGKQGSIRIWSKAGKLVGSCVVWSGISPPAKGAKGEGKRTIGAGYLTLVWCKPDSLLIADGKSQLLECNPLRIDCKNKLEWKLLHSLHKRGMFALTSNAPRIQTPEMGARGFECAVWSASQDRSLVRYNLNSGEARTYMTCGGFLYMLQYCPYDARKVAVAVGDGAVRVWETESLEDEDAGMGYGHVSAYWHNVQGKVLAVAWHPTKENLIAFGTAEARVGLIDTSGIGEKPAKVFQPAGSSVYSVCWGEGMDLYVASYGELMLYNAKLIDQPPKVIPIELEGAAFQVSCVAWYPQGFLLGSMLGSVVLCDHDLKPLAAAFPFKRMIHMTDWHPQETSSASEPSPYRNLIATCSYDKCNDIVIVEVSDKEEGGKSMSIWKTLSGHTGSVFQLGWNPHKDNLLLSTSQDRTVRVWDVTEGTCISIFGGHAHSSLSAVWSLCPSTEAILSGGSDCALRLWSPDKHPAHLYQEIDHEIIDKKKKTRKHKKKADGEGDEDGDTKDKEGSEGSDLEEQAVAAQDVKKKISKKFILPMVNNQLNTREVKGLRILLQKYLEQQGLPVPWSPTEENVYGIDYIKMFGSINDLNELLDDEASRLLDTGCFESWAVLCIFRGYIDACIQQASQRNLLDPFLLSISPSVSFKYWKDTTLLYLQQIDRLAAKGLEQKLTDPRPYGGPIYRRVAVMLGLHDVRGAVSTLHQARLFKEAYVLSRTRYMDSLAEETLKMWAAHANHSGSLTQGAMCYIVLGELSKAAEILGRSTDEEALRLAADIASSMGQTTFASHIHEKCHLIVAQKQDTTLQLPSLPTRAQLLLDDERDTEPSDDALSASGSSCTLMNNEIEQKDSDGAEDGIKEADNIEKVDDENVGEDVTQEKADIEKAKDLIPENLTQGVLDQGKGDIEKVEEANSKSLTEDNTKELLARLPEMMNTLMKESQGQDILIANRSTHLGDGDTKPDAEDKVSESTKVSEIDTENTMNTPSVE